MTLLMSVSSAISGINTAPSADALWASVKEFARPLGYTHLAVADASRLTSGASAAIIYTDHPEVVRSIDRSEPYLGLPYVQQAMHSSEPFLISDMRRNPSHSGRNWEKVLAEDVLRGEGLVVPVYENEAPVAGFMFGGESPNISPLARSMLVTIAHISIERLLSRGKLEEQRAHRLSPRELECIELITTGKSDGEAAGILGISTRTVRYHVGNARRKLGARSRLALVAQVLRSR